jgi:hypothetical protein
MTYAEIRAALPALNKQEREGLALDLKAIALLDDPEYLAEITRRGDERGKGTVVTDEDLRRRLAARQQAA